MWRVRDGGKGGRNGGGDVVKKRYEELSLGEKKGGVSVLICVNSLGCSGEVLVGRGMFKQVS